jgi:hypothetical protein
VGLISYSIYLWHWPILVFAKYRYALVPGENILLGLGFVAVSLLIGFVSWRFIEQPFRRRAPAGRRRLAFASATGVLAMVAACGVVINRSDGAPGRWPMAVASAFTWDHDFLRCSKTPVENDLPDEFCIVGNEADPVDTIIWGDSHAAVLASRIVEEAVHNHRAVMLVIHAGCPPLLHVTMPGRNNNGANCRSLADKVMEVVARGEVRRVVLAARWALYGVGKLPSDPGHEMRLSLHEAENPVVFDTLLTATVHALQRHVSKTIIIGPIPEVEFMVGRAVARNSAWGYPMPPPTTRTAYEQRQRHVLATLSVLAKEPHVRLLRPDRWMCDQTTCAYTRAGHALYADSSHLNVNGQRALEPMFAELFTELGWQSQLSSPPNTGPVETGSFSRERH